MATDKSVISQVEEEHESSNEEKQSLLDQLISNLAPLSPKPEASIKPELFGVENGEAIDFDKEENNNSGSNTDSIVDNIVSHLPPVVLISDDAAPTTDEASILIHAVVHE
ncbi:unnamed protein product [Rhodiola kirilowii]